MSGIDKYTTALLHLDNDYVDVISNSDCAYSNTTFSAGKFNQSVILNGSNSNIVLPNKSAMEFGDEDFTIDFWCKLTGGGHFFTQRSAGPIYEPIDFEIDINSHTYSLYVAYGLSSWTRIINISTVLPSDFFHIALVRSVNNLSLYQNGILLSSGIINSPIPTSTESFRIGATGSQGLMPITGYIDEFRISKGIARWTSDFTPPTSPYSRELKLYIDSNNAVWGMKA